MSPEYLVFVVINALSVLIAWYLAGGRLRRNVSRLVAALSLFLALQGAVGLVASGFGWGWPEAELTIAFLALLGIGFGLSYFLFAAVINRRVHMRYAALMILLWTCGLLLVSQTTYAGYVPAVGCIVLVYYWTRSAQSVPRKA
jgi:hypothetical protein